MAWALVAAVVVLALVARGVYISWRVAQFLLRRHNGLDWF